jgi:dTDP-4-dehydrorhamnose 3,5-epimerase-like enzyme
VRTNASAEPSFIELPDSTDSRGFSYSILDDALSRLSSIHDVHIASVAPGAIRGNHFHLIKTELITVIAHGPWSFYWDTGVGTPVHQRRFVGQVGLTILVPPSGAHAVKNAGGKELLIVVASDRPFARTASGPSGRDAYPRTVCQP